MFKLKKNREFLIGLLFISNCEDVSSLTFSKLKTYWIGVVKFRTHIIKLLRNLFVMDIYHSILLRMNNMDNKTERSIAWISFYGILWKYLCL